MQTPGATLCHQVLRAILGSPKGCKHRVPPLCHHRAVNATCHPRATKCHVPPLCHQGGHSSTHFPTHSPAVPPRTCRIRVPPPCPAGYPPAPISPPTTQPCCPQLCPPSLRHAVLHITTARSTHHPLQLRGGKLLLNKTKEQLYFSRTFNNLPQPAARQQFPIRRARRKERSGFVGTEGGICRALHEGKNNIAVRCWCCN